MKFRTSVFALSACLAAAAPVFAQSTTSSKSAGLVLGLPGTVGVTVRAAERVGVRIDAGFSHAKSESSLESTTTSLTNNQLGASVAGLFYMKNDGSLRPYLSPRFSVNRSKSTTSSSLGPASSASGTPFTTYGLAGSYGAEYAIGDRFSVFGEVGVNYSWQDVSAGGVSSKTRAWTTRSAIGAIVRF